MALKASTGLRNLMLGQNDMRTALKDAVLNIYSGSAPATADAAATGTLLCTITGDSATAKVKQLYTITPIIGDASGDVWSVTLNGITAKFTDDASATVAEVCTGLSNALKVLNGTAITTPASDLSIPATEGLFTITDNTTNILVEAATAGVSFTCTATVTGATTASLTAVETTPNAFGLKFETYAGIASGIIEKDSGQVWSGVCVATGTAGYYRLQGDSTVDTGGLSTTLPRLQGTISTANADMNMTSINKVVGATETVQSASWTLPV